METAAAQVNQEPYDELEHVLRTISESLVDYPDRITIQRETGRSAAFFEVFADPTDLGTLIGAKGKHADAIRIVLMAAAAVRRIQVTVRFSAHGRVYKGQR